VIVVVIVIVIVIVGRIGRECTPQPLSREPGEGGLPTPMTPLRVV